MKKINYILVLTILLLHVSCDGFLSVPPDRRTELDSKEKIAKLLVTAYPIRSAWMVEEFASDNTDEIIGIPSLQPSSDLDRPAFFWENPSSEYPDSPAAFWSACYLAVSTANHALEAIDKLGNEDGRMDHERGEALLTRAYAHFRLVNFFCKHYSEITSSSDLGIPYIEKPETTVNPQYQRGTVEEVYAKIKRDIEEGLPLIDDSQYDIPKYHFNKKAAYAFAIRFNLYCRDYDKVITYASKLFGDDPRSSLRNWRALSLISDFDLRGNTFIDTKDPANLLLTVAGSQWPINVLLNAAKYTHSRVVNSYETSMARTPWTEPAAGANLNYYCLANGIRENFTILKYPQSVEVSDPIAQTGQPYLAQVDFTTDEALLSRAEAYAMTGEYDLALADLQVFMNNFSNTTKVLTRAELNNYYDNLSYYEPARPTVKKKVNPDFTVLAGEQENFIHCILQLRRVLTLHEGLRWYDVKRYGIEVYRRKVDGMTATAYDGDAYFLSKDDERRALQIPSGVISAGLQPNPR